MRYSLKFVDQIKLEDWFVTLTTGSDLYYNQVLRSQIKDLSETRRNNFAN